MAAPFPHHYEVTLQGAGDGSGALDSGGRSRIVGGAPPEFDGRPQWWSPEHLLLASVTLCLMTTLQALAGRARIPLARYGSRISGTLEKTAAGIVFTEIVATMEVAVAEEHRERTLTLVDSAMKHCIVSNALKVPVTVEKHVGDIRSSHWRFWDAQMDHPRRIQGGGSAFQLPNGMVILPLGGSRSDNRVCPGNRIGRSLGDESVTGRALA